VDRTTELKYRDCVQQVVARLKTEPGGVWSRFAGGIQRGEPLEETDPLVEQMCLEAVSSCPEPELRLLWLGTDALWKPDADNPDSRASWEGDVVRELYERVRYAAGDAGLDGDEKREPEGEAAEARFRFDEYDMAFLANVARRLMSLIARPGLTPKDAAAIRRAVAALNRLPEVTAGTNVRVEIGHRMGDEALSESYRYTIALEEGRIAITSSGSQHDPTTGTHAFDLESVEWGADGQIVHKGNRDSWLERLIYALGRDYTLRVTDESVAGASWPQAPRAET
jgi:hypothetical protein